MIDVSMDYEQARKRIRHARIALVVVGALTGVQLVIHTRELLVTMEQSGVTFATLPLSVYLVFGLGYLAAAAYIWLSFLARTRPYGAAIAGLSLYATDLILAAVLEPSSIWKGIILKVVIVTSLVRAVQAGRDYARYARRKSLEEIEAVFG